MVRETREVRMDGTAPAGGPAVAGTATYPVSVESREWLRRATATHRIAVLDKAAAVILDIVDQQDLDVRLQLQQTARAIQEVGRGIEIHEQRSARA